MKNLKFCFKLLFTVFSVISIVPWISSMLVLMYTYKDYRKVYKTLKDRTFYVRKTNFGIWVEDKQGFIWFVEDNDFCLGNKKRYIHEFSCTYMDPYTFYWLCKYQRWFKKNIDINKLSNE